MRWIVQRHSHWAFLFLTAEVRRVGLNYNPALDRIQMMNLNERFNSLNYSFFSLFVRLEIDHSVKGGKLKTQIFTFKSR